MSRGLELVLIIRQKNECPFIEDNVRQGYVEHFQNLNPERARANNHGYSELEELYHDKVRILNKLKESIKRDNKVEMKTQIVADVIPIFVIPTLNLLHHNNVGVTYAMNFNFIMEPIISIPLYFVAMPQSIIIVIKTPFVLTSIHIVVGIRSTPQIPRGIELVSVHEEMPKDINKIFVGHPLDISRCGLDLPLGPPGYFGLPMVNPSRP
jgi:hypothetical protein